MSSNFGTLPGGPPRPSGGSSTGSLGADPMQGQANLVGDVVVRPGGVVTPSASIPIGGGSASPGGARGDVATPPQAIPSQALGMLDLGAFGGDPGNTGSMVSLSSSSGMIRPVGPPTPTAPGVSPTGISNQVTMSIQQHKAMKDMERREREAELAKALGLETIGGGQAVDFRSSSARTAAAATTSQNTSSGSVSLAASRPGGGSAGSPATSVPFMSLYGNQMDFTGGAGAAAPAGSTPPTAASTPPGGGAGGAGPPRPGGMGPPRPGSDAAGADSTPNPVLLASIVGGGAPIDFSTLPEPPAAMLDGHGQSAGAPATGAPATGAPATGTPATGTPATGTPATGAQSNVLAAPPPLDDFDEDFNVFGPSTITPPMPVPAETTGKSPEGGFIVPVMLRSGEVGGSPPVVSGGSPGGSPDVGLGVGVGAGVVVGLGAGVGAGGVRAGRVRQMSGSSGTMSRPRSYSRTSFGEHWNFRMCQKAAQNKRAIMYQMLSEYQDKSTQVGMPRASRVNSRGLTDEQEAKAARYARRAYLTSLQKRVNKPRGGSGAGGGGSGGGGGGSQSFMGMDSSARYRNLSTEQTRNLEQRARWASNLCRVVDWPIEMPRPPFEQVINSVQRAQPMFSNEQSRGVMTNVPQSNFLTALMEQKKDQKGLEKIEFGEPDTPENILVDLEDNGQEIVRAGTLAKLVERLTYEKFPDPNYLSAFLLTYRSFTTPNQLMDLLTQRFHIEPPRGASGEELLQFKRNVQIPVRIRVFNVLKQWTDKHFFDFADVIGLAARLRHLIEEMQGEGMANAAESLTKILQKHEEEETRDRRVVFDNPPPTPLVPVTADASAFSLMTVHPREIARQMTLKEYAMYSSIKPGECLNQSWTDKPADSDAYFVDHSPHIRQMIERFNVMSEFVAVEILKNTTCLEERVAVVSRFIELAQELRSLNNFNGLMEILAGLQLTPIFRLKRTWEAVPPRSRAKFQALQQEMNRDLNYKSPRAALALANPPCIPYLGIFLTDLTFIEDGNHDLTNSGLINFDKRRKISEVIAHIQQFQQTPYCLEPVPQLQDWLWQYTSSLAYTESEYYQMSLEAEPRGAPSS